MCILISTPNAPHDSVLNPSLLFHRANSVLLGTPNGSSTFRATSTPATGRLVGSSRSSYDQLSARNSEASGGSIFRVTCTKTEAWTQYLVRNLLWISLTSIGIANEASYICLASHISDRRAQSIFEPLTQKTSCPLEMRQFPLRGILISYLWAVYPAESWSCHQSAPYYPKPKI